MTLVLEPTGLAQEPMIPVPARIVRVRREIPGVTTLVAAAARAGAPYAPGQFSMLYAFGVGEVPISVSGDTARADEITHTIRAVGTVTDALCRLRRGSVVGLRGPFGCPWPLAACRGRDLVLVAGGIGMAPLRPVVYHVLRHRAEYGRVSLLVGARTADNLLYTRELSSAPWRRIDVRVTVDSARLSWTGRVGTAPALLGGVALNPDRTDAFICGPEVMMKFTMRALNRAGLPDDRIHLSLERNMGCAVGLCGRCQLGPEFICKDGPVLRADRVRALLAVAEL